MVRMMSYIDINKEKEKALYRVFKEIEENGKSIINTDSKVGQIISRKIKYTKKEQIPEIPHIIVTSNRFKNITTIMTNIGVDLQEIQRQNNGKVRFITKNIKPTEEINKT